MPPVPTLFMFADEAGNFDFSPSGTAHFTVCAVTMRSLEVGHQLLALRHELALEDHDIRSFHATEEKQAIRDRVFPLIQVAPLEIDAVVLEKRKAYPRVVARGPAYFYQLAWHLLFKHIAPLRARREDDLLVVAGSVGTQEKKQRFKRALTSVVGQHSICRAHAACFWDAATHPCLQVADYCTWAIHRWAERADPRSYAIIEHQVRTCYWPFS
jgi:hypothetical protein